MKQPNQVEHLLQKSHNNACFDCTQVTHSDNQNLHHRDSSVIRMLLGWKREDRRLEIEYRRRKKLKMIVDR